jgi:putative methyltransferase (TIGR04325 family)
MNARDFLPPIALKIAHRVSGRRTYATYDAALADCTERAYQSIDIVDVVLRKTIRYRDEISASQATRLAPADAFSFCSLLASLDSRETSVIDFGGACGALYFLARAVLPQSLKLRWIVVETPEMARRAASILSTDELSFSSDLGSAVNSMSRVHLLHTSGTLQYVDKPYDVLQQIVSASAEHILFNRLTLTKGSREVITVQESWLSWNGPGPLPSGVQDRRVRYPCVLLAESAVCETIQRNYDIVMTFDDSSGVFQVRNEALVGIGMLARLRRTVAPLQTPMRP